MKRIRGFGALPLLVLLAMWGCDSDTTNDITGGDGTDKTCLGCHASEDNLKLALGKAGDSGEVVVYDKSDG